MKAIFNEVTDTVTMIVTCGFCGKEIYLTVVRREFDAWRSGQLIQHAMPFLTADERELLISQTCPKCWAIVFPKED